MLSKSLLQRFRSVSALMLAATLLTLPGWAQEVTGNIVGKVTDPSGAAVANASVTIRNTAQGDNLRVLRTSESGEYTGTLLPVGTYAVIVEASGFRKGVQENIPLTASQKYTADFRLEIGSTTEQVNVEGLQNQVELQTAQQSGLISGTQVRELSLNNRNFEQLVVMQPGVVSNMSDSIYMGTTNPTGGSNTTAISVNGLRQSQNNWTIDGADNVDRGSNITIQQYPSVDAIEEIKVVRTPYSAEFGRAAGGQVSVITRSGTNQVHGSAYEFFRNDQLNANNFFNNLNNIGRPPLRYNDFGYTVGGPVYIPKLYHGQNKTFFFFSEEFRRVINYSSQTVVVPTLAERQGNFPGPVCTSVSADGGTCLTTGTSIANINPVAAAYLKDIYNNVPAPQSGNNLALVARGVFNARQEIVRIDHNFGSKLQLSGRFLHDSIPTIEPGGLFTSAFVPGVSTTQTNSPGWSSVIRGISSFSSSFYNEAGWAWSHGGIFSSPIGLISRTASPDINPTLAYPGNPSRVPTLAISGFTSLASYGPYNNFSYNHSIFDNMTKTIGRHTLKFGAIYYIYRKNENQLADNAGGFTIANTPRPTGGATLDQAFANFLLGNVSTFSQTSQDLTADLRSKTFETYIQDDIRLRSNFTLNVGLRYSKYWQPTDANGLLTNFDPALFNPATAFKIDPVTGNRLAGTGDPFNGIIQGGKNSPFGDAVAKSNNMDFAPRIGFAWDPFGDGKTSVRSGYGIFYDASLVGSLEQNIGANPTQSFTSLSISNTRLDNATAGSTVVSLAPTSPRGWDPNYKDPYVQQWSFEIQRQLPTDAVLSVAYVGNKGTHLIGIVDLNQVPVGAAYAAGLVPATGYINTSALRAKLNILRPYQGYNAINMVQSRFNSNYNGLQTSLAKRFGKSGGVLSIAYTFSKAITDNGSDRSNAPQNTYDIKSERGLAPLDRRHVFTSSYVYPLPFLKNRHNALGYVAGGWELSGIVELWTGLPATATSSLANDPGGLGSANNATSVAGVRPDQIANPNNGPQTIYQYFNTAAFAEVPIGQIRPGDAGRYTIQTPGIVRWDFSVFKEFAVKERVKFQLRGESFNFLNHTNFNAPTTALGNVNFGKILSARDPRQVQLGLKAVF